MPPHQPHEQVHNLPRHGAVLQALAEQRFDPAPAFVLWLVISNLIQLMLLPPLLVGQNLQGRHGELRAENDFEINQRAEQEVEAILPFLGQVESVAG